MKYRLPEPPTTKTPGNDGDLYLDTKTGVIYICKGCNSEEVTQSFVTSSMHPTPDNAVYTWETYVAPAVEEEE
mgnify:CR=1 FL=1